ncbi:hypothetical protein JaAD80_19595 [Janthinobacterium sp. AD80]|nr:hypothetical protein JaAD80_19595 [Janthinobacterium sp. AD80]
MREPMSPTCMAPVLMPMPMRSAGQPRALNSSFRRAALRCISSALATARLAWSGKATGAPQKAITASPMYLSRVPPWLSRISCDMAVR